MNHSLLFAINDVLDYQFDLLKRVYHFINNYDFILRSAERADIVLEYHEWELL